MEINKKKERKSNVGFIGDVHGKFDKLNEILRQKKASSKNQIILVGDVGIGFHNVEYPEDFNPENGHTYFIRGNHDNPSVCSNHKNYLGDFGYIQNLDLFYVSGASSIDKHLRTEGLDWWENEELDWKTSDLVLTLYDSARPSIMVSHDCPLTLLKKLYPFRGDEAISRYVSHTNRLLEELYQIHQPKYWVFGHHHVSINIQEEKTLFMGLAELEYKKIHTKDIVSELKKKEKPSY